VFPASRPSRGVVSCVALGLPGHPPKGAVPRYPPRGVLRDWSRPVPGSCRGAVSPLTGGFPHTAVVEALQKTQQRYKRNFDSNVDTRNKRVRVGAYAYTTNHQENNELQRRTVGPTVVLDADDATYVIDVYGEERRVNSDHVTPAPRPSTPDEMPHPLLDGLDRPESTPPVPDEYVIDRLLSFRRNNVIYSAKVRWFDYGPKDDSWEPLKNLPRNLVI